MLISAPSPLILNLIGFAAVGIDAPRAVQRIHRQHHDVLAVRVDPSSVQSCSAPPSAAATDCARRLALLRAADRDYGGKLRVDQSYKLTTGEGAGWGAFWGAMIGALIAIPFTGGASGAVLASTVAAAAVGGGALGATGGALKPVGGRTNSASRRRS